MLYLILFYRSTYLFDTDSEVNDKRTLSQNQSRGQRRDTRLHPENTERRHTTAFTGKLLPHQLQAEQQPDEDDAAGHFTRKRFVRE